MRLKLLRALRLLALSAGVVLSAPPAHASEVTSTRCERAGSTARCQIFLQGEVKAEERLYLSSVNDRDTLLYRDHTLGSTGTFLGRAFDASFFPRVYPLAAIQGAKDPVLELAVQGGMLHPAGLPAGTQVKIIDERFPLWRLLGPAAFEFLSFAFLVNLTFYLLLWLRQRHADGWIYPRDETRWFFGSLAAYLLLRHEVAEICVPLLWSERVHLFSQRVALLVMLWSGTMLLLGGRFSDRSCIERAAPRSAAKAYSNLAHFALVGALGALAFRHTLGEVGASILLMAPLVPALLAQERALRTMEWRRVLKRSSASPLLFHLGLIALPSAVLVTVAMAWYTRAADQRFLEGAAWIMMLLGGLRMRAHLRSRERSRELAVDCRKTLQGFSSSQHRIQALCDFIADEWGAARVSVISVDDETGFVLNSSGPDAIPEASRAEPRRLGPFLRRACKHEQMLYAPVAEELGHDLQSQGLKHSSLAIPLRQESRVRAVLCMMAEEGERIPPDDANQLEMLVETLSLEVLSAVAQSVAEARHQHLLEIARTADALAVEDLDHWGRSHYTQGSLSRVVLGGDSIPAGPFLEHLKRSPLLGKVLAAYRADTRAAWVAVATAFEFMPKDNRDDFWVISPREFRNPRLRALGPERVAALLATILERQARAIAARQGYAVLGYCGVRLVCGRVGLRQSTWHGAAVEIDSDDFSRLLDLRQRAAPGTLLFSGDPAALDATDGFQCRARPWDGESDRQIFSILFAAADKKEVRRLENLALEKIRELARRVA